MRLFQKATLLLFFRCKIHRLADMRVFYRKPGKTAGGIRKLTLENLREAAAAVLCPCAMQY